VPDGVVGGGGGIGAGLRFDTTTVLSHHVYCQVTYHRHRQSDDGLYIKIIIL